MLVIDIVRHGEAEPSSAEGDAGRPLSARGAEDVRALGRRLVTTGWRPTRVFASPLKRARDTARVLTEGLEPVPLIETLLELEPEADPTEVLGALEAHGTMEGHVLLVSHMPLVSRLAAYLSGSSQSFGPGDICRIHCPDGTYRGTGRIEPIPGGGPAG